MRTGSIPHVSRPVSRVIAGSDYMMLQAPSETWKGLDAYWEAGGRTFDSAQNYGDNTRILATWIKSRGVTEEAIHLDKCCHHDDRGPRVTREAMREDLERNQEKLGRGRTDLFVLHRDDENVPVGEIIDWLNELKDEDRIEAFGGSNWRWQRIREANEWAAANGKQGMSLNNPTFSLAVAQESMWANCVTLDRPGFEWHRDTQFPVAFWSSTARGYFVGETHPDVVRTYDNPDNRARRDRAQRLADEKGLSIVQIALAYVLSQPLNAFALSAMRNAEQAKQNVAAGDLTLTPQELAWLETGRAESS